MHFLLLKCSYSFLGNIDFLSKTVTYQTATATIFMTDSFKHWQKLTKGTPLFPILPNIIPAIKAFGFSFSGVFPQPQCFRSLLKIKAPWQQGCVLNHQS